MDKKWIIAGTVIILLVIGFSVLNQTKGPEKISNVPKTLKIGGETLNITVADTEMERSRGLSGKGSLKAGEGMLFVFEKEGYYGFWMKDMKFPIDMAWLNKNKEIIYIKNNVLPATYPNVFSPSAPALYVLETEANFFASHKIKIGDVAEF